MIATPSYNYLSPVEYLQGEETSPIKHEYRDGEVYAMAGASNTHVIITLNIASLLRNHLRGRGCQAYIADTKAHIESINTYYYPDVIVSCDQKDTAFNNFLRYPCLIIEVLSASTEAYDRGGKFRMYRNNSVLKDYLLVSSTSIEMDLYHQKNNGEWVIINYKEGDTIALKSINFSFAIEQVYRGLILTPE
jgi:Uma2 family endonuclease